MSDSASRTDRELFAAASSGDAQALAELAGRHARGLYDFALRGTLDEQQAAAVIQSTFRRIREPGTAVPGQIEFRTWLYSLGLVEVLAVSNETRTARISTDDQRFYRPTAGHDPEVAHWAWQAARGLRTRDYCVLDLTLRRGLTPEEVAEAASLTRSNLYASIGRARGAFEETFAAMLLFEHGRDACPQLDEMVESAPGTTLRPALRHQIIEHSDDCDACRRTLDSLPLAADVYISLADIETPAFLTREMQGQAAPVAAEEPAHSPLQTSPEPATATAAAFAAGAAALEGSEPARVEGVWDDSESDDLDADEDFSDFEFEEDDDQDEDEDEDDGREAREREPTTAAIAASAAAAFSEVTADEPAPVPAVQREPAPIDDEDGFGDRVTGWVERARGQPLMWTYAALGILAVIAIYLGVAVADSLQSGGGDSGAVPLDSPVGAATGREIDCGDSPILVAAGNSTVVSFDPTALDGYEIESVSVLPVSNDAREGDLVANRADGFSIEFVAAAQDELPRRTEQFDLRVLWQRGADSAHSSCEILVSVGS